MRLHGWWNGNMMRRWSSENVRKRTRNEIVWSSCRVRVICMRRAESGVSLSLAWEWVVIPGNDEFQRKTQKLENMEDIDSTSSNSNDLEVVPNSQDEDETFTKGKRQLTKELWKFMGFCTCCVSLFLPSQVIHIGLYSFWAASTFCGPRLFRSCGVVHSAYCKDFPVQKPQ